MSELKTKQNEASVNDFINSIAEEQKRKDLDAIKDLMEKATKAKAKMWGPAIIGFGDRLLVYESGRKLDWFVMGFSPRKQNIALYINDAVSNNQDLLKRLGKYKTGKGCIYINKLSEVDLDVLKEIIQKGLQSDS
jgi:hypothetical protein